MTPGDNEPVSRGSLYWKLETGGSSSRLAPGAGPERIGNYRLLDVLGEGGMGCVYLAEQIEPVKRHVALKLIRRGLSSKEVVARFESERQALALMSHPGIARVFDAGASEDGSPYFVMEFVPGHPITRYCEEQDLGTKARLELFIKVCDAVQHAHQKAIIHRDIKPSNVLVTEIDGSPAPKIIDFGIAKALSERLTGETALTAVGQIIGTPEYMSPEQAGMRESDIDTRTDIYSLGVLLYELLSGVLPFDSTALRQGGYTGILRTICEVIPERPSTRLRRLIAEEVRGTGQSQRAQLARVRELRGDLDWITLKALEKDRARRYASASELASDVRRHLSFEPVLAGPPSALYRLKKLARRHREKLVAAAILVILLATSFTTYSVHLRTKAVENSRAILDEGRRHAQAFVDLAEQREKLNAALLEKTAETKPSLPPWERKDEMALRLQLAAIPKQLDAHYSEALSSFDRAFEAAPPDSGERVLARKASEAILWERYKEAEASGAVTLSEGFFKGQVESLGLGTFAAELEGRGKTAIESEPDGAEVYCFRFEESEMHLLPIPFAPTAGLIDPSKGLLGEPFLRVEKIWDSSRSPFRAGDRMLDVAGSEVRTRGDLARALERVAADERIATKVLRSGERVALEWTPFPAAFYSGKPTIRPGKVLDLYVQFGLTFEGYPIDFADGCRLGVTRRGAPVPVELPRGSYVFVFRKRGFAESRLPLAIPIDSGPRKVRLFRSEDVPEGFVHVPAGPFTCGGDDAAYQGLPRGREEVGDFFMSRLEVTFGDYLEFVRDLDRRGLLDADGYAKLAADWQSPELEALRPPQGPLQDREHEFAFVIPQFQKAMFTKPSSDAGSVFETTQNKDHPVFGISMMAGVEYARWLTEKHGNRWRFRLPRDLEWEKAARGADRRFFVWGNELVLTYCRSLDGCIPERNAGRPEIVGSYPLDESVYGIRDLTGSIAEPTLARAFKNRRMHVYRGGEWNATDARDFRAASRNRALPERMYRYIGLRLVAEPMESRKS